MYGHSRAYWIELGTPVRQVLKDFGLPVKMQDLVYLLKEKKVKIATSTLLNVMAFMHISRLVRYDKYSAEWSA